MKNILKTLCIICFLLALLTAAATAAETAANAAGGAPSTFPTLGEYLGDIPQDMTGGTATIFSRENVPLAMMGAAATIVAFTIDRDTQSYFRDTKPLGSKYKTGNKIGEGTTLAGVVVGMFAVGEIAGNVKLTDTSVASAEAGAVDLVATEAIKYAAHRKRPSGSNNMSFPSGHTSGTATLAATISEMYDWNPFVAVPLYGITAFVGASRIQSNQHHLSDVVAGGVLGTIIGKSYASYFKKKRAGRGRAVAIMPYVDGDAKGVMASLDF
ncbi:MAG: phosphatase PAP2 family protein [Nitrospiraceae bacterium]|nr:phosphatase PAP2 family protein [Nitrospiraceae bacterium]